MPIIGIGTDIVEISRIERAMNERFLSRVFTEGELALIRAKKTDTQKAQTAASCFAAKEAVAKALGTGFNGLSPLDLETLRDERGAPYIVLAGTARELADKLLVDKIHVSLSHSRDNATAFVILEGGELSLR